MVKGKVSVEHRAQIATHSLAIVEAYRLMPRTHRCLAGLFYPVKEHPEYPPYGLSSKLYVEDLQPKRTGHAFRDPPGLAYEVFVPHLIQKIGPRDALVRVFPARKNKKWANAHFFCRIDVGRI